MAVISNALDEFEGLNKQNAAAYAFRFHHKNMFMQKGKYFE